MFEREAESGSWVVIGVQDVLRVTGYGLLKEIQHPVVTEQSDP